jgi:putative sigma-54 modulation protein
MHQISSKEGWEIMRRRALPFKVLVDENKKDLLQKKEMVKEDSLMKFMIRGENIALSSALKDYAEKKIQRLEKYFDKPLNSFVYINMKVFHNEQQVEVTIPLPKLLLRAEESSSDLYAAIDLVVDKLEQQIRKYKTKISRKRQGNLYKDYTYNGINSSTAVLKNGDEEALFEIVREKRFNLKPMDTEEAILQMDMLGHNFFVYFDAESEHTNVVYKRKDGKYGLILPQ